MVPQQILFDLDDTLIHCNKYFDIVLEQFIDEMSTWFASYQIDPTEFQKKQLEIDTLGVNLHGFTLDHFPQSLVETYSYFSKMKGRKESDNEKEQLLQLGKSVYDAAVEPYPYMVETLEALRGDGHQLFLYTGGVAAIQQRKVEELELSAFFGDRIFIRQHKTTETLRNIIEEYKLDPSRTWMVGNSIRTDILPALENRIHAIYIPATNEWAYNIVDINVEPAGAFFTIPSLQDVKGTIRSYLSERKPQTG